MTSVNAVRWWVITKKVECSQKKEVRGSLRLRIRATRYAEFLRNWFNSLKRRPGYQYGAEPVSKQVKIFLPTNQFWRVLASNVRMDYGGVSTYKTGGRELQHSTELSLLDHGYGLDLVEVNVCPESVILSQGKDLQVVLLDVKLNPIVLATEVRKREVKSKHAD